MERPAEVLIPCSALFASQAFFQSLGFLVDYTFPADAPRVAALSRAGLRLRLEAGSSTERSTVILNIYSEDASARDERTSPDGTRVVFLPSAFTAPLPPLPSVPQALEVVRAGGPEAWAPGRAGLLYRDLLPSRLGGRAVVSHILLREGGTTQDYVHYHVLRLQLIYIRAGWVKLGYEGNDAFIARAGDCILQPPTIRHVVLESSPGLEVLELASPAEHPTVADRSRPLRAPPPGSSAPPRDWGGQLFSHHVAAESSAVQLPGSDGWTLRELGVGAASGGIGTARYLAASAGARLAPAAHGAELRFLFCDVGEVLLEGLPEGPLTLRAGDSAALPQGYAVSLAAAADGAGLLELCLPSGEARGVFDRTVRQPSAVHAYGGEAPQQFIELYLPPSPPASLKPLVALLHGGFWRPAYGCDHTRPLAAALADAGFATANIEYRRLIGEPDAVVGDVMAALAAAPGLAAGAHDGRMLLIGHSAGGHLAMLAAGRYAADGGDRRHADTPLVGTLALAPVAYLAVAAALGLDGDAVDSFLGSAGWRAELDPAVLPPPPTPVRVLHGGADARVPRAVAGACGFATLTDVGADCGHFELIDPESAVWPAVLAAVVELCASA